MRRRKKQWRGDPETVEFPPRPDDMPEFDCFLCAKGDHDGCDSYGMIYCCCRRELHEEEF